MTGMGSRLLKTWLLEPRRDRAEARQRLSATTALRGAGGAGGGSGPGATLRAELKGVSEVERITARVALRQVRPR
jgi:DNA mismatch repair protein MutS